MIVVYAGRRTGSELPEENLEAVSALLVRLFSGLKPRLVIGGAAAGADQLVLSAAQRTGASAHLVLAGGRERFRETSVADCGERWGVIYDQILAGNDVTDSAVEPGASDEATYRAATDRIWELAAEERGADEPIVTVLVSRPRDGSEVDHTEELAAHLGRGDGPVLRIDPEIAAEERPRAFVAMPFGTRPWRERQWKNYDADLTYQRILLPALIGAGYHPLRADTEALLEIIDAKMLRAINRSPLLVADLATVNPNVMWELGVRHAWRPSGTVLLAPEKTPVPFDVKRITVHPYRRGESEISDQDCVYGLKILEAVLADVASGAVDSPVFRNLDGLEVVELAENEAEVESPAEGLLEEIALASDLGHPEELIALGERVASVAELSADEIAMLEEQVGINLVRLGHHADAVRVLRPLAEADGDLSRVLLQEQFAHSLIREGSDEGLEERLAEAESRLEALISRQPARGETYGLLGSASKARIELESAAGEVTPSVLSRAINAYMKGMSADPGDYYPGINAIALLRLRGQRLNPNDGDLASVAALAPVVRFAVTRDPSASEDPWAAFTLAECDLHKALIDGGGFETVEASYAAAAGIAKTNERASAIRQLTLFRNCGDPAERINPLIELVA